MRNDRQTELRHRLLRDFTFTIPLVVIVLLVSIAISPDLWGAGDPFDCTLERSLRPPSASHPFGFDLQGCDYYTRVLHGTRSSLTVGVLVVAMTTLIGVTIGSAVGLLRGPLDWIMGLLSDVVLSVPLILAAALVLTFVEGRGIVQVVLALVVLGWPPMTRLVRAQVRTINEATYVTAARSLGAGKMRLLARHILPNAMGPLVVFAASYTAIAVTAEAILTFLGTGLQLPAVSWGLMLSQARFRSLQYPHLLIPGLFLTVTVACFVLIGEALRRALEPEV
jgi:oligopeptide transport system permease protein